MESEDALFERQGFGGALGVAGPVGLLLVDFVNGFADPALFGGGNINTAVDATVPVLEEARALGLPIAHSRIVFEGGAAPNIFALKARNLLSFTEDAPASAIIDRLAARPGELVVRKTVPSAFFGTDLLPWLISNGVRTLLVAGATTSGCVRASVVDAMSSGLRPVVLTDCCGDRSLSAHKASMFDMEQKYADLMNAASALTAVKADIQVTSIESRRRLQ